MSLKKVQCKILVYVELSLEDDEDDLTATAVAKSVIREGFENSFEDFNNLKISVAETSSVNKQ